MANKFESNNRSSNIMKEIEEEKRAKERELRQLTAKKQKRCWHNHISGARVIPIGQSDMADNKKARYSDTTYICDNCGTIFETTPFTQKEVRNMFFNLNSMLAQIQMLTGAKLTESELEELDDAFDKVEWLDSLMGTFYNDMIQQLSKDGRGKPKKSSKGGIGINSGMMQ